MLYAAGGRQLSVRQGRHYYAQVCGREHLTPGCLLLSEARSPQLSAAGRLQHLMLSMMVGWGVFDCLLRRRWCLFAFRGAASALRLVLDAVVMAAECN